MEVTDLFVLHPPKQRRTNRKMDSWIFMSDNGIGFIILLIDLFDILENLFFPFLGFGGGYEGGGQRLPGFQQAVLKALHMALYLAG